MDGDERCRCSNREFIAYFFCTTVVVFHYQLETDKLQTFIQLLGINIFTYILGVFIIFFLSMNAMFGPGWLGQSLGWEDVGTFTRVSDSLPLNVDVSKPDYLL